MKDDVKRAHQRSQKLLSQKRQQRSLNYCYVVNHHIGMALLELKRVWTLVFRSSLWGLMSTRRLPMKRRTFLSVDDAAPMQILGMKNVLRAINRKSQATWISISGTKYSQAMKMSQLSTLYVISMYTVGITSCCHIRSLCFLYRHKHETQRTFPMFTYLVRLPTKKPCKLCVKNTTHQIVQQSFSHRYSFLN